MNLILLQQQQFVSSDRALLTDRQINHLKKVIKVHNGGILKVGQEGGFIGQGRIDTTSSPWAVDIISLDIPPPPRLPVDLVLALPRPQMIKRIVQTVATMGVNKVFLIQTERVEKSFWQSPSITTEALQENIQLGLEQGVDTHAPELEKHPKFFSFVKNVLPNLAQSKNCLIAHPGVDKPAPRLENTAHSVLAIGPEGGFTDAEVGVFQEYGFSSFHLGARILKVETAVPVILSSIYSV